MGKVNACFISFFMNNIDRKTVELQHEVVKKFNPEGYQHYSIQTDLRHGASMDVAWCFNGIKHPTFKGHNIPKRFDHDIVVFLDIDCLPLNSESLKIVAEGAAGGKLIGNIQRSNHIQNDQHVFVAPSLLGISVDNFISIGMPSGLETHRADVAEEYTFAAEKTGHAALDFFMPLCYDEAPAECASWALKDGMPVYGRGTTFGRPDQPLFWHQFQSFHPGQQEKFHKKCESLLQESV